MDRLPWWTRLWAAVERVFLRLFLTTGWIAKRLARSRSSSIDGRTLATEMAAMLKLDDIAQRSDLRGLSPEKARVRVAAEVLVVDAPSPAGVAHRDLEFEGPAGPVGARLYEPPGVSTPSPAVVFFHGGGWVTGSVPTHDGLCRRLALGARCRVVSVEYRRAPERRFPAAVDDSVAAYRGAVTASASLGIDRARIGVAGDSAGGNLAAVVATATRDDAHPPRFAALLYAALDMTARMRSHETVGDKYFLTMEMIEWYYAHYMGNADRRDPRASPLLARELPRSKTLVFTCGFDPLRDEGRAYADRLEAAGVPCSYREFPDLVHGFALMSNVPVAARALDEVVSRVRAEL